MSLKENIIINNDSTDIKDINNVEFIEKEPKFTEDDDENEYLDDDENEYLDDDENEYLEDEEDSEEDNEEDSEEVNEEDSEEDNEEVNEEVNKEDKGKVQMIFGGCGGMFTYLLGVASTIQKHFELDNVIFSGSSGGIIPSILLALDFDVDYYFEKINIPMFEELNSYRFGCIGKLNNCFRNIFKKHLTDEGFEKIKNIYHVSLTNCSNFENEIISGWKSKDDLLEGMLASSFIPIFDSNKLTYSFRGKKYIDGSLSNSYPIPFDHLPSIVIKRDRWRKNNLNWLWIWTNPDWHRTLYNWGKEDAMENLHEFYDLLKKKSN